MGDSRDFELLKAKPATTKVSGMKCEYPIEVRERDCEGKTIVLYHKKCGKPAAIREIVGTLTSAKAILCDEHAAHEDYKIAQSTRGYPLGVVDKDDAQCVQVRLPGIGVQR